MNVHPTGFLVSYLGPLSQMTDFFSEHFIRRLLSTYVLLSTLQILTYLSTYNNLMRWVLLSPTYYRVKNWDAER